MHIVYIADIFERFYNSTDDLKKGKVLNCRLNRLYPLSKSRGDLSPSKEEYDWVVSKSQLPSFGVKVRYSFRKLRVQASSQVWESGVL